MARQTQPKVRVDQILHALSKRNQREIFLTKVKTGPTTAAGPPLHKIDALSIKPSWSAPCITAYEVKVSRSDFLNDDKWPAYREVSHRFYWACPAGMIQPEEVADDCGLIWYNPETGGLSTRIKALFRNIEMPVLLLYYIVISRLGDPERHPFFSSRREYLEAWLQDRAERVMFGARVGTKLATEVGEANERVRKAESKVQALEKQLDLWTRVQGILREHGVNTGEWNVERRLRERLSRGVGGEVLHGLNDIRRQTDRLLQLVAPQKEGA